MKQYKLCDYKASVNLYLDLFQKASSSTDEEELLSDIITNLLACASNLQSAADRAPIERLVESTSGQIERTYEFFFNLSQVQMMQQLH